MVKPTPILLVHYGRQEWIRGSERCLIDLVHCLDRTRFAPVIWCDTQVMADAFKTLNIPVYVDEFPILLGYHAPKYAINGTQSLINKGKAIVKEHDIALIHANSAAPNQWLASVANQLNLPLVTHLHARYVFSDRLTLRVHQADHMIGVSQPVINQMLEDGIESNRTHVIPNGIDTQRLLAQAPTPLPHTTKGNKALQLVSIGSLIHRKGMDLLIRTVALLKTQNVAVQLTIIGDGEEMQNLVDLRQQLDLEKDVHFLGEQSEAFGFLRANADIFITGAREEVFGLVLAEAGLAGLPCIATNVGGIASVVQDQQTGLLVDEPCPELLAKACQTLNDDRDLLQRFGTAAKAHVYDHFTIAQNTQRICKIYEQAIQNGRRQKSSWLGQTLSTIKIGYCYLRNKISSVAVQDSYKKMIILDTIPFNGGSKIANQRFLATLDPQVKIHILTCQPHDWSSSPHPTHRLYPLPYLQDAQSGWRYVIKHSFIALQLLSLMVRVRKVQIVMGASLPSNDLALLFSKKLARSKWLQFIHGNVYPSRLNARLLQQVDYLYYLPSTKESLQKTLAINACDLETLGKSVRVESFINGIELPSSVPCLNAYQPPSILWAASALKWKGLDTFICGLKKFSDTERPLTNICFIRPTETQLAISQVNVPIHNVHWHEAPENLSEIREHSQIFVSTSHKEPFGLSILEALAAGMCVCIPADEAYWDRVLTDQQNCIKYHPNDSHDLYTKLLALTADPEKVARIGAAGFQQAQQYCAQKTYSGIRQTVERYTL